MLAVQVITSTDMILCLEEELGRCLTPSERAWVEQ